MAMQHNAVAFAFALLVVGVSGAGSSYRSSVHVATRLAQLRAHEFLKAHDAPSEDELAELKAANPDAYGIVKALLTKRSLGLLDPRHPRANFAGPKFDENKPVGEAAFSSLASPEELHGHAQIQPDTQEEYAEVPAAPVHHDWLNWKPTDSAVDDDAMVQNVLGQVAQLSGSKSSKNLRSKQVSDSPLADEEASILGNDESAQSQPQATAQPEESSQPPKLAATQKNSFWNSIDLESALTPTQSSQPRKNSYLKSIDLNGDDTPKATKPVAAAVEVKQTLSHEDSSDSLSSFSFDDQDARIQSDRSTVTQAPVKTQAKAEPNSLDSWLGIGKPKETLMQKKPAAVVAAKPSNPYLADLA